MHRTQILLEERQYAALKAWGRRRGMGLSALIRLAVEKLLGAEAKPKSALRLRDIRGLAADPKGPAGRDHDRLLYRDTR